MGNDPLQFAFREWGCRLRFRTDSAQDFQLHVKLLGCADSNGQVKGEARAIDYTNVGNTPETRFQGEGCRDGSFDFVGS
eukprot:6553649-Pyramimonas_sp.AAC.1